jgi:GTPase
MNIFLEPEIEEGNIEYKRILKNDKNRIEEYTSQLKWRVKEGQGEAIYYLGIEDDGSFYNWNDKEKNQTIQVIKKMVNNANLRIAKIEKIYYNIDTTKNYYFKAVIREKERIYPEKRILLLGPSGVGKSTFLANILLSKVDEYNKEARLYLFNHKHEIIQKKTSSFNYLYYIHNNIKWVFIEAPGDDKYKKTRNKIILSFGSSIDICLIFEKDTWEKKDYYVNYLHKMNIPHVNINIYDLSNNKFPNYWGKSLIDKNDFFNNISGLLLPKFIKKNTEFVILQSFENNDIGVILTGILKSGTLNIGKNYYLYSNFKKYEIIINSIHLDGKPLHKISAPKTVSICIKPIDCPDYIGIITNEELQKIHNMKVSNEQINIIYKDNKILNKSNYKNYYQTNDKIFLVEDDLGYIF